MNTTEKKRSQQNKNKKSEVPLINTVLGDRLSKKMFERGYKIKKLSDDSGVSVSAITAWINGNSDPQVSKLQSVCDVLGITVGWAIAENNSASEINVDVLHAALGFIEDMKRKRGRDIKDLSKAAEVIAAVYNNLISYDAEEASRQNAVLLRLAI